MSSIFKAYDIRGIYPAELDETTAQQVGRAFIELVHPKRCVVGHDMRVSSPALANKAIQGIVESGSDVIDIGMVSSDQFYFVCAQVDAPGLMITASHNPKEYNGIKMIRKIPYAIGKGTGMEEIERIVTKGEFVTSQIKGSVTKRDYSQDYAYRLLACTNTDIIKPLKVVIDAGNGMGGVVAKKVYERLPTTVIPLYWEPDGTFPHHGPDPLQAENRKELEARVVAEGADVGFAFDGDVDRFFTIDHTGALVPGDFLTALLAQEFLTQYPGATIVYDVRASWAVKELIERAGGKAAQNRIGHSYIKKRMLEEAAVFGGEVTGHYYFKDFFYCDSGVLPSLKVLELISKSDQSLYDLLKPLRERYHISGEINSTVSDGSTVLERLKKKYADGKLSEIDGVSIEYDNWHFNVRSSNTEPLLRLNLESIVSNEDMEKKRDEVLALIRGS